MQSKIVRQTPEEEDKEFEQRLNLERKQVQDDRNFIYRETWLAHGTRIVCIIDSVTQFEASQVLAHNGNLKPV